MTRPEAPEQPVEADVRVRWEVPDWSRRRGLVDSSAGPATPSNGRAVLVVEHERGMWSTHADILRVAGYTVIQANAGDDALRMLQHMRFDAIVLDVTVPDAEVVALLTMVAAPPPVVMLSSIDFDDEPRLRLARKAVAHLHKPVPPAELVGAVARAMRRADL